jgi:hypothetical protein
MLRLPNYYCTHRQIPETSLKLLDDLKRLHTFIASRLVSHPNCFAIPAGDLLAAKINASSSKILAAYSGWGAVHGSGAWRDLTVRGKSLYVGFSLKLTC